LKLGLATVPYTQEPAQERRQEKQETKENSVRGKLETKHPLEVDMRILSIANFILSTN
jgi:hypothetical protein